MWPDILEKARHGGLNVIQTYVFWNVHEPEQGKFNFEGNYDLVKFIRLVQQKGMYVTLRVGPFIQAEWNHGGLPYWLREVPGIIFRTDNEPYKKHMKAFVGKIIQMMKDEKLFAPQGGPIILAQIENEYNHIQLAYEEEGDRYVQWAANMAVAFDIGVPWVMCKQKDAPDPVINACNGRHCGDTFSGPNKPYKPSIWTENWTAQYRVFGDPVSQRSAEDIAFSVARFFSKNGNLVNYYMYHGGTNFGRTSSAFTTTRYYDEAPLDEYGLERQPKWSHLRDAHTAMLLCRKAILHGVPTVQKLNTFHEVRVFEKPEANICAAFITNNHTTEPATINFRGSNYFLPPHSISVLPDCKTVVYNTQSIVSQHNARNFVRSAVANNLKWEVFSEPIPSTNKLPSNQKFPAELYVLLKDTTDYGWYTTSFELDPEDLPKKSGAAPVLRIMSLGHTLSAFVNGQYIGTGHGTHDDKTFEFEQPANFKVGTNYVSILATTVGLPDSGAYMEHRYAGPKSISVLGLNTGTIDLSENGWGNRVGLKGEQLQIFSEEGSKKVEWSPSVGQARALSWFKTRFATPEGRGPVAIRMTGMGKGMIWVNGQSIGRHWMTFLSPLGHPTQAEYHIPRSYLNINGKDNLLVVLEEENACPDKIEILNVDRDTICSHIAENEPANVNSWVSRHGQFRSVVKGVAGPQASLKCPSGKKIVAVEFASFGDPSGYCGKFSLGNCNAGPTKSIVEKECLGKKKCMVSVSGSNLNGNGVDGCPGIVKTLAIQAKCSY
ncbi:beta-galactosidase 13-like [Trifolium pratense]|uniref:beta-galactosidase 13-like n=1 Tax=Trifolium pratense TaxID=57577 RepID=UPI001E696862|nr:beta-galactosidase 13-like [Trifolium pratense]